MMYYAQNSFKEKRQTFSFSAQVDYFKIKMRKFHLLKHC